MNPDNRLNQLLFGGEAMHSDTDKALVLAGVSGALFGTIRPGAPVEHTLVKASLGVVAIVAALRIHPGAEKIARDWTRYQSEKSPDTEADAGEEWECPECGAWNYLYHVEGDTAYCSECSTAVSKEEEVKTRPRVHR